MNHPKIPPNLRHSGPWLRQIPIYRIDLPFWYKPPFLGRFSRFGFWGSKRVKNRITYKNGFETPQKPFKNGSGYIFFKRQITPARNGLDENMYIYAL
jgi:hypothetical protein